LPVVQRPGVHQHRPEPPLLVACLGQLVLDAGEDESGRLAALGVAAPLRAVHQMNRDRLIVDPQPPADAQRPPPGHLATRRRPHTRLSSASGSDRSASASPAHNMFINTGRASIASRAPATSSPIVQPPVASTASIRVRSP